jgi:hypothetical protein
MGNVSYSDILNMPIYERRYFLGKILKTHIETQENIENKNGVVSNGKGKRKQSISGNALKTMINNGEIPLK